MTPQPDPATQRLGHPRPDDPPAVVEVLRSAERLQVGRAVRVSGRAVLRKYVVTETITQTFQLRREEVRLDLEPGPTHSNDDNVAADPNSALQPNTEASTATRAEASTETDANVEPFDGRVVEVVLHREVPVVRMQVEPIERVRLHVDTVTEEQPVGADLRREQVDLDRTHG